MYSSGGPRPSQAYARSLDSRPSPSVALARFLPWPAATRAPTSLRLARPPPDTATFATERSRREMRHAR